MLPQRSTLYCLLRKCLPSTCPGSCATKLPPAQLSAHCLGAVSSRLLVAQHMPVRAWDLLTWCCCRCNCDKDWLLPSALSQYIA